VSLYTSVSSKTRVSTLLSVSLQRLRKSVTP